MSFENMKTRIMMLAEELEVKPEDDHELHMQLNEMFRQIRATGMPLPADLVELERKLTRDVEGVEEED